MFQHLLRPFSYLTIEHKLKWKVDWLYPCALALLSTTLVFYLKQYGQVSLFSDGGVIVKVLNFVQSLPGFYIAALSAIATFNKIDIDKIMPSPAPKIDVMVRGRNVVIDLTRRRFLCSMFAFLTAESLVLIVLGIFASSTYIPIKAIINESWHFYVSASFTLMYFLLFWQMIVASFWGLYYLGERLHQPDS